MSHKGSPSSLRRFISKNGFILLRALSVKMSWNRCSWETKTLSDPVSWPCLDPSKPRSAIQIFRGKITFAWGRR
jgi:hypothetical protein